MSVFCGMINFIIFFVLIIATTIEGQARENLKLEEVVFNRPFIFYVRDLENDVILTAGKIVEIVEDEIPVTFKV